MSFKLAARLNAAGRLGANARLVVELLTSGSPVAAPSAGELAHYLEDLNARRQQAERRILSRAREIVEERGWDQTAALVLAEPDWHPGIIGIVASRLVDLYGRPVLMVALRADQIRNQVIGQGSGRSVPGFELHQALAACSEHLLSHGGHAAAAGFTVIPESIDALRDSFAAYAGRHFEKQPFVHELVIEAELPLSALTTGFVRSLEKLEPYGMGNRRPYFLAGGLRVVETPKKVGNGERHLSFRVRQDKTISFARHRLGHGRSSRRTAGRRTLRDGLHAPDQRMARHDTRRSRGDRFPARGNTGVSLKPEEPLGFGTQQPDGALSRGCAARPKPHNPKLTFVSHFHHRLAPLPKTSNYFEN